MVVKLTSLLLTLTACTTGGEPVDRRTRRPGYPCSVSRISPLIDDSIRPFVEEFSMDAVKYDTACLKVKDIMLSTKVSTGIAGYCMPGFAVVISQNFWDDSTEQSKRTLVYHELGHCALDLDHTEESEIEIMNPYVLPDSLTEENWSQLVEVLFRGKGKTK